MPSPWPPRQGASLSAPKMKFFCHPNNCPIHLAGQTTARLGWGFRAGGQVGRVSPLLGPRGGGGSRALGRAGYGAAGGAGQGGGRPLGPGRSWPEPGGPRALSWGSPCSAGLTPQPTL